MNQSRTQLCALGRGFGQRRSRALPPCVGQRILRLAQSGLPLLLHLFLRRAHEDAATQLHRMRHPAFAHHSRAEVAKALPHFLLSSKASAAKGLPATHVLMRILKHTHSAPLPCFSRHSFWRARDQAPDPLVFKRAMKILRPLLDTVRFAHPDPYECTRMSGEECERTQEAASMWIRRLEIAFANALASGHRPHLPDWWFDRVDRHPRRFARPVRLLQVR